MNAFSCWKIATMLRHMRWGGMLAIRLPPDNNNDSKEEELGSDKENMDNSEGQDSQEMKK